MPALTWLKLGQIKGLIIRSILETEIHGQKNRIREICRRLESLVGSLHAFQILWIFAVLQKIYSR